tara:strand:- start:9812 stop:10660 length:849 start_codon:yes stop_codon:yes gene_type:complete
MKCLVTGHKGYIGSALFKKLQNLGYNVRGIDLKEGKDILKNLAEYESFNPDYIFHLAAFPRVQFSVENPSYTLEQNVLGTSRILEFAHKVKAKRVIFSSSSAVYGDDGGPSSPYGLHKLMSESECKLYSELYGVDTVCLRYFNVYSKNQPTDGSYSTVIAAWSENLKNGSPLRIDGTGEQRRDFIHLDDIVDANIFCMKYKNSFTGNFFDVGIGENYSLNFIKKFLIREMTSDIEFYTAPPRPGDTKETLAMPQSLIEIGWKAKINFKDGLVRCFKGEKNET